METNIPNKKFSDNGLTEIKYLKTNRVSNSIFLFILLSGLIIQCEGEETFYRPNLPEKLCSLGIIDLDDTLLRHISFEKSYQKEYPDENQDSLRNFSFTISSSAGELFTYQNDTTKKKLKDYKIPSDIIFNPGEKYFLTAREDDSPEIKAETVAPFPPPQPVLVSKKLEIKEIPASSNCREFTQEAYAFIEISFDNDFRKGSYYALLLEADGYRKALLKGVVKIWMDYSIIACNTPSFLGTMNGLYSLNNNNCQPKDPSIQVLPVTALFIDGSRIPDNKCIIKLATKYHDGFVSIDFVEKFRIKLISIPEELYFFEKSQVTYWNNKKDPFGQPIYNKGNIKGGFGVFSICRSSDLVFDFPTWLYD